MTTIVDTLVEDYLSRLERAAADLPPDRRPELLDVIGEHIAATRAAGHTDDEAVRTLLNRLGEPDEIVAAAREDVPATGGWGDRPVVAQPAGDHRAIAVIDAGISLTFLFVLLGPASAAAYLTVVLRRRR